MQAGKLSMGVSEHERATAALAGLPALQRGPRERSIFRQNRAKGPNPLSVQKRKQPLAAAPASEDADAAAKPKRRRSRKKARDAGGAAEPAL